MDNAFLISRISPSNLSLQTLRTEPLFKRDVPHFAARRETGVGGAHMIPQVHVIKVKGPIFVLYF